MYRIMINGNLFETHETIEQATKARNNKAKVMLKLLYAEDIIDKYALEDWLFGIDDCNEMEMYIDEAGGYSFNIEEFRDTFDTDEEAIEYFKSRNIGKHETEIVTISGKNKIICGTCMVYDDPIWGAVYNALNKMVDKFGIPMDICDISSMARDYILEQMEEYGYEFVDVYDEF